MDSILEYPAEHASLPVARRYLQHFLDAAVLLAERAAIGHVRPNLGNRSIRFWSIPPYLMVYDRNTQPPQILRILHSARDIPSVLR